MNWAYPARVNLSLAVNRPRGPWEHESSEILTYAEYTLEGLLGGGGVYPCPVEQCYVQGIAIPIPIVGHQRPYCCVSIQVSLQIAPTRSSTPK